MCYLLKTIHTNKKNAAGKYRPRFNNFYFNDVIKMLVFQVGYKFCPDFVVLNNPLKA